MKRITFDFVRCCRRNGGLCLGAQLAFPTCLLYANGETWETWHLTFGLIFWRLSIDIKTKLIHVVAP